MISKWLFFLLCLHFFAFVYSHVCSPIGVRLSFGLFFVNHSSTQMLSIRFDTKQDCPKSYVTIERYDSSIQKIYCQNMQLSFDSYSSTVHRCSINQIKHGQKIKYMVFGWSGNQSDPHIPFLNQQIHYQFISDIQQFRMVSLSDWSYLRILRNKYLPLDNSMSYLLENDNINAIFINGDIAYDLQTNNGQNYEDFLSMLSQVSIRWPVIINQGNHQNKGRNTYIYNISFQTYEIISKKVVHLIFPWFNFILFDPYNIMYNNQSQNVYLPSFLRQLQKSVSERAFTITASHYPFRCNGQPSDCQKKHEQINLFYNAMFAANVPLYLGAHHHAYERHYPFQSNGNFIKTNQNEWKINEILQKRRLISIVQGVAGNDVSIQQTHNPLGEFTASVSYNVTGYGILSISDIKASYSHFVSSNPVKAIDQVQIYLKRRVQNHLREE